MIPAACKIAGVVLLATLGLFAARSLALTPPEPTRNRPTMAPAAPQPTDDEPDLKAVRAAHERWWAKLKTLSVREIGYATDPAGERLLDRSSEVVDLALAPGHRFAFEYRSLEPEKPDRIVWQTRWDGKTIYNFIRMVDRDSPKPDFIYAIPQSDPPIRRDEWFISEVVRLVFPTDPAGSPFVEPRGRGVDLAFDRDAEGRPIRDSQGRPRVVLSDKTGLRKWELDPDHDWLPARERVGIERVGSVYFVTVTKFARRDGLWFPVEGTIRDAKPSPSSLFKKFEVTDLKINEPIPDATFRVDDFPSTILVPKEDVRPPR